MKSLLLLIIIVTYYYYYYYYILFILLLLLLCITIIIIIIVVVVLVFICFCYYNAGCISFEYSAVEQFGGMYDVHRRVTITRKVSWVKCKFGFICLQLSLSAHLFAKLKECFLSP